MASDRLSAEDEDFALVCAGVNHVDRERFKEYIEGVDEDTRYMRKLAGTSPFADIENLVKAL